MKVVFLSHTAMGGSFVVGSHHFAKAFAEAGHATAHVTAPVSFAHVATAFRERFTRKRLLRWAKGGEKFGQVLDVVPFTLCPWKLTGLLPGLMKGCSRWMIALPFRGFSLDMARRADWLIVDDPRFVGLATQKTRGKLVYRATDLYAEMSHDPMILKAERMLCARADLLVATSDIVGQHLENLSGRPVHVIKNGVDFELFSGANIGSTAPNPRLPGVRGTRAVYVGSFDSRFGMEALRAASVELEKKQFILIGPGAEAAAKKIQRSNVTALGPVPYAELPPILAQCAVGLLPLSLHAANAGRSPMKLYEYAAAGLAVAATTTPELIRRKLSTLSLADDDRSFAGAVSRAFGQATDRDLIAAAKAEAAREGWTSKARQLADLLMSNCRI